MYMGKQVGSTTAAAALIKTGPGRLVCFSVNYGTTADTLTFYDNTSAAGTVLWQATVDAGAGNDLVDIQCDIDFTTGCYADFTGGALQIFFLNTTVR